MFSYPYKFNRFPVIEKHIWLLLYPDIPLFGADVIVSNLVMNNSLSFRIIM
jgi:hypothetical protein